MIPPGTRLGHYEILSAIGKGGMGEVWRARDTKLGREVAIKTLPSEFAQDPDRLSRFEREARLLASLNHPNIAAIHGLEEHDGARFLVLELVEGDTLADRIRRGAIPLEDALKLALEIAGALEAAHEKGVVHRDLKPANIKVTPEGRVKVLDFGLAKAFGGDAPDASLSNSPTLSMAATQAGIILGTAAYMSPEQAKGLAADRRADVFAFGSVLYEMLTGRMAFPGELTTEILASVINQEPDYTALDANLDPRIHQLLGRCFEKQPRNRWQAIGDVRIEIERILESPAAGHRPPGAAPSPSAAAAMLPWVAALLLAILAGVVGRSLGPEPDRPVVRIPVGVAEGVPNIFFPDAFTLLPDGTLVYAGSDGLYRRELGSFTARAIEGAGGGVSPFASPDGQWIGFLDSSWEQLSKAPLLGGGSVPLCEGCGFVLGASWGTNDTIVFGSYGDRLWRVSANGGEAIPVSTLSDGESAHVYPQVLPDGDTVLFTIWRGSAAGSEMGILSLDTGAHRALGEGIHPRYASSGHIVFARAGGLWAAPFDHDRGELTGEARRILENVGVAGFRGAAQFALSENGTLAYKTGLGTEESQLTWLGRDGNTLAPAGDPGAYAQMMLSPNEDRVAIEVLDPRTGSFDIHALDLAAGIVTVVTSGSENDRDPVWSPDGGSIVFTRSGAGGDNIFQKVLGDASPAAEVHASEVRLVPEEWIGDSLLYHTDPAQGVDFYSLSMADKDATPLPTPPGVRKDEPHLSPDGNWLAYEMEQAGVSQIFISAYPEMNQTRPVSREGGVQPRWRGDGRELYFLSPEADMMRVPFPNGPGNSASPPERMFPTGLNVVPGIDQYAVTSDGERFLIAVPTAESRAESREIKVVVNWFEELREEVPVE